VSLNGYISTEVEIPVSDLVDMLDDDDIVQLYQKQCRSGRTGDPTHQEVARRLALAIEQGDGKAAADHAHRLCMDLAGVPVMREIHIGRAPWERAA
jgi:hypothetical protein